MDAILSIKPKFVKEIAEGRKTYEFRKIKLRAHIGKIYVYASSPICRIVGEFTLGDVLEGTPEQIWALTSKQAGITKAYFNEYYSNKNVAFAFEIKSYIAYDEPIDPYQTLEHFTPPQSFCYIKQGLHKREKTCSKMG